MVTPYTNITEDFHQTIELKAAQPQMGQLIRASETGESKSHVVVHIDIQNHPANPLQNYNENYCTWKDVAFLALYFFVLTGSLVTGIIGSVKVISDDDKHGIGGIMMIGGFFICCLLQLAPYMAHDLRR